LRIFLFKIRAPPGHI
jgi:hypothetical protein